MFYGISTIVDYLMLNPLPTFDFLNEQFEGNIF